MQKRFNEDQTIRPLNETGTAGTARARGHRF